MVVGDDEANRLQRRPYRAAWVYRDPARVRGQPGASDIDIRPLFEVED
jgi:hypothetical protein